MFFLHILDVILSLAYLHKFDITAIYVLIPVIDNEYKNRAKTETLFKDNYFETSSVWHQYFELLSSVKYKPIKNVHGPV